jgi:uncharacterized membrane protein (DUF4010 family)
MPDEFLLDIFLKFGIAAALGFLIGLEREKANREDESPGVRDFILFALVGAVTAFLAQRYENSAILIVGFAGVVALLISCYWQDRQTTDTERAGITTEISAMLTFFLGVLVMKDAGVMATAIGVVVLVVLSQKRALGQLQSRVQQFEINAVAKLLVISFIVLPILPRQSLEAIITFPLGRITDWDEPTGQVTVELIPGLTFETGQRLTIHGAQAQNLGMIEVRDISERRLTAAYQGDAADQLAPGQLLTAEPVGRLLRVALSAIHPYRIWLIVVLVSFISFIGYVLVKAIGANAGIGLTGLIGGLASSTVTAVSFARRSLEAPDWNRRFAIAVILASTMMFPRLLVQIAVVNYALMRNLLVPIGVMAAVGLAVAILYFARSSRQWVRTEPLELSNPFSLKSALTFAVIFTSTLIVTRLAIDYLGDRWLPLIAALSGLTDADAIAFSISDAHSDGLISLDWASFNLVLGALTNTLVKLVLVFWLGHRGLFREVLFAFLVIGASGLVTMLLYYDLGALT